MRLRPGWFIRVARGSSFFSSRVSAPILAIATGLRRTFRCLCEQQAQGSLHPFAAAMSISLDAVASRHLWHMQDIGRLWEQHSLQCGSPVFVSVLVDVPATSPGQDRSVVHVFPTTRVSDESFLGRALEAYTSSGRREGVLNGRSHAGHPAPILPPASVAPNAFMSPHAIIGTQLEATDINQPPAPSSQPSLAVGVTGSGPKDDEFGLRRFQAAWRMKNPITYHDLEHLCPPVPLLEDDYVPLTPEKRTVRVETTVIEAFLETVRLPTLSAVTWDIVNGVISCARHFIDKISFQKPWYLIGPAELYEVEYVCNVAGTEETSLSVASMASKAGGVSRAERALTIAVLCTLSPFWRMVVLAYSMFRAGRRPAVRPKKIDGASGRRRKKVTDGESGPQAKKMRKASQSDGEGDEVPKESSPPVTDAPRPLNLQVWLDAPGLDVEDRCITDEDLRGACGWFWKHRPQPGEGCLPLLSYKTLGDLGRLRQGHNPPQEVSGTFARLENVPGDNDCFYHVIAIGLMDRLGAFPNLHKSPFWMEVGVHPGLLRWGVAAFQRAMLGDGALAHLFPTWLGLTCPGQSFSSAQVAQSVLQKAIVECEGERSWMGSTHGEYAVLADILGVIIRVFSPIGCAPDGTLTAPPASQDARLFSVAGARVEIAGQPGSRRCVLRAGDNVVQLRPSCIHVPLRCVAQAQLEARANGAPPEAALMSMRAKELALSRSCMVLGVIHDGGAHFMYPHVYPNLLSDYSGVTLPAFNLAGGPASL